MARVRRLAAPTGARRSAARGLAWPGRWVLAAGLLICLSAASAGLARGQAASGWSAQSIGPADLDAVAALPGTSTAWAVGGGGAVYATADGSTWAARAVGATTRHLRAIAVAAAGGAAAGDAGSTAVWAVGDGGTILRSADGGASWSTIVVAGVSQRLNGVAAPDPSTAWIVGDVDSSSGSPVVLRTIDGGASWFRYELGTTSRLLAVAAAGTTVWAVGDSGTVLTKSGAGGWVPHANAAPQTLFGVAAVQGGVAWAVGANGTLATSRDGGATWSARSIAAQTLLAVAAASD
ncbi:MAG TPA: hypothetical protein VGL23_18735, partial [Chloroflexota bacterium]